MELTLHILKATLHFDSTWGAINLHFPDGVSLFGQRLRSSYYPNSDLAGCFLNALVGGGGEARLGFYINL